MLGINIHITSLNILLDKLSAMLKDGTVYNEAMQEVAGTSCDAVKKRIHEEGLAADGGDIGQYSSTPVYVNVTTAIGGGNLGQPVGKTGKAVFAGGTKKGQQHKTAYLAGGYAQYKQSSGAPYIGKVNLYLSGALSEQFEVIPTAEGFGLGWDNDELLKRALAIEDKYGKPIWGLTAEEKQEAVEAAQNVINHAIY